MNENLLNQEAASDTEVEQKSYLDHAVQATQSSENDTVSGMLKSLVDAATRNTVQWDRSVSRTLRRAEEAIDQMISEQLREIMHHDAFQKLEGSWRGLNHLAMNSDTNNNLRIKVLNVDKKTIHQDLDTAIDHDQSHLFKSIYEAEFGTPGGIPYGVLIGDYQFDNSPQDIEVLQGMARIGAASFCPFITAPSPKLFDRDNWSEVMKEYDLEKLFRGPQHIEWRSFRESEDSRFVTMTLPRVLARRPYGPDTLPVEAFNYQELPVDGLPENEEFCWFNSAYAMGTCLTSAFTKHGWCTAMRGRDSGGKVDNLPIHSFIGKDGDGEVVCPTEELITSRRSGEFDKLGFIALSNYKDERFSVFFGGETTQKPKKYDTHEATENAQISARLPYIMATSRIAHYLKLMARDMIGRAIEAPDIERILTRWVNQYVNASEEAGEEARAKRPLKDAKIQVVRVPGESGAYNVVAHLQPWLQLEKLHASLRTVARIPQSS